MSETLIIYWDVLWLINLLMDFILLTICGTVLRYPIRVGRTLVAGVVGATLSLVFLWYEMGFYLAWLYKILLSWMMVKIAFPVQGWQQNIKTWIVFYIGAWLVGGVFYSLVPPEGQPEEWFFWLMIFIASAIAGTGLLLWREVRQKGAWQMELLIGLPAGDANVLALVDSGNRLVDPLSRDPVIIVEQEALAHLLPGDWKEGLGSNESTLAPRYIPYASMGNPNGLLIGFRPLKAELRLQGGRRIQCQGAVIGLTKQRLDPSGQYQALVPATWEH